MKICLEGSVEEIEQFLYGDGVKVVEAEEECKCKCERGDLLSQEKMKSKLINDFADAVDDLLKT